ncbi:MAG: hypothetical protein J2P54_10435 [Bradyrhizobiaceae bacterium]|nr:hypothetical protein [Bradyrhizobiaceae bacterium]
MTKLKIAVAALAMTTTAAHSQTAVDQWTALCSKGSGSELVSCRSYARGVADTIMLLRTLHPELTNICIPAGVAEKDLVDLALPYVQGQPPTSPPLPAANLLTKAFSTAFPCTKR